MRLFFMLIECPALYFLVPLCYDTGVSNKRHEDGGYKVTMSIIDKKGKLFGKLNIIDLIAIVLILAVLALIGYKLMDGKSSALGDGGQAVVYTVKVEGVEPEVYESIKEMLPSQLMAADELQDAYVTEVKAVPVDEDTFTLRGDSKNNQTVTRAEAGTYDLIFTIEGNISNTLTSEIGTQEIRVGKSHIVKTTTFELEGGVITSCERQEAAGAEGQ